MTDARRPALADPASSPAGDRIELRGLRVRGTHGVLPEEKEHDQPFELDLDLQVDLTRAAGSDQLADTVDYARVAESAGAVVSGPRSYQLLEALADAVGVAVLAVDDRVAGVTVGLRKLEPPMDVDIATVGVRITRVR